MPSVRIRVDEELKNAAADVLAESGITVSDAIRMLFLRIVEDRKLPFEPFDAADGASLESA